MTFEEACVVAGGQKLWSVGEALLFGAGLVAIIIVACIVLMAAAEFILG